ncbi:sn-glycerol-3-phosphate ABC transporter substrate-binding protein UgpB [Paracoccus aestuarii]|uniref:sn-glycerol-3-phosphate-binding periplasmic protein UgpB n=1 Tax=Paracoccus aestuarii TaxID=453842 RepID=A0A418ZUU8_9RHOB|nr:sn-glycerol-3-phosphate ABC transporter substrate-binding protein UgpB [Paracoccus aestuarii]RJL01504.1 sn-glycerol-3-phosphate ABC transporter substrate-binding protein UgpB [Paracoccus aestuarii]WCQ99919.1 sn-glycerol-3-phosphate ABC transporter substrate-binding protein UgpB [Paracoccus aestuarii]
MNRLSTASVVALLASLGTAQAQTSIEWWHAMGGELGAKLEEVAQGFNDSQDDYRVMPSYKGTYPETMTAAIAAFRANQQPAIVQVFEVGTGTMMAAEGAIVPVHQLMEEHGQDFDADAFLPSVVGYYTDTDGNMLSMPFNSSTPILYYNKSVFETAGLDPEQPPRTWAELEQFSRQIMESGAASCGFTTQWVSWIQTENLSAWHNQPIGTLENGFGGTEARLSLNGPVQVKHWGNLKSWADEGLFKYGGPVGADGAAPMFYSQECAMMMGSSASRAGVIANASAFDLGFGMLPYYDDVEGAPQNSIIGGATLWVLSGKSDEEYAAAAAFFDYLTQPEVQADWASATGYLPITEAAREAMADYYAENPGADTGINQITLNDPTENSKGLRFGNYVQIRGIIDEEFEQLLAGSKDAQGALDSVVARGDDLLEQFQAQ